MLIKNKRGDLSIVLLVFLVLFLCGTSLFIFYNSSGNVVREISHVGIVNEAIFEKNEIDFIINDLVEKSLLESYLEIKNKKETELSPSVGSIDNEEIIYLDFLRSDFDFVLERTFGEKFNFWFNEFFDDKETSYGFENEVLYLNISGIKIEKFSEKINVSYSPKISLSTSPKNLGLDSFKEVYESKNICEQFENTSLMENCFNENLNYFVANVREHKISEEESRFFVTLSSKREFLIEGGLRKFEFRFIIRKVFDNQLT